MIMRAGERNISTVHTRLLNIFRKEGDADAK